MWKTLTICALLAGGILLGLMVWQQHARADGARVEAARLEIERDSVMAEVGRARSRADSAAMVTDSLEALRALERADAERRAWIQAQKADSLEAAITDLLPPDQVDAEVRQAVALAVGELRETYEVRLVAVHDLLRLSDETIETLQHQVLQEQAIQTGLRQALGLMEGERDAWRRAAEPSFFGRLKSNAGILGGVMAVTTLATLAVSR